MVGVVMTYYNRNAQLINTLNSFLQYNPQEFFVVVVDDGSPQDIKLPQRMPFAVYIIKMREKYWTNPEPAYNAGINYALKQCADIIILQNAECMHTMDMLTPAKQVTDETYITFGCYSQGKDEVPGEVINNKGATFDGESAWYNHPIYRPVGYDFCSAITASNIRKLNGYDERFSSGIGYGDNYLLARIQMLGLRVLMTASPYVIHQWHEPSQGYPNGRELAEKNRFLYNTLIQTPNYRAQHPITKIEL